MEELIAPLVDGRTKGELQNLEVANKFPVHQYLINITVLFDLRP